MTTTSTTYAGQDTARRHQAESQRATHDPRCDSDLCTAACPYRAWAEANDYPYPGRPR